MGLGAGLVYMAEIIQYSMGNYSKRPPNREVFTINIKLRYILKR